MLKPTIYYGKYHRSTIDCMKSNNKLILIESIKFPRSVQYCVTLCQLLWFHELQSFELLRLPIIEYEHGGTFLRMFLNFGRLLIWMRPATKFACKNAVFVFLRCTRFSPSDSMSVNLNFIIACYCWIYFFCFTHIVDFLHETSLLNCRPMVFSIVNCWF